MAFWLSEKALRRHRKNLVPTTRPLCRAKCRSGIAKIKKVGRLGFSCRDQSPTGVLPFYETLQIFNAAMA
jgi:hypothetical protein